MKGILRAFISCIFSVSILLSSVAKADDYQYFVADDAPCGDRMMHYELRISPTTEALEIGLLMRPRGVAYYDALESWSLAIEVINAGSVIVDTDSHFDKARLSGLDDLEALADIQLTPIAYDGNPKEGCEAATLSKTASVHSRYEQLVNLLTSDPMEPEVAPQAMQMLANQPPIKWLPELDQQEMKTTLEASWKSFWPSYQAAIRDKVNGAELTVEQVQSIYDTVMAAWLLVPEEHDVYRERFAEYMDEVVVLWSLRHRDDPDQGRLFAVESAEQICLRIQNMTSYDWPEYFRLVSGVPVELWTRDRANQIIEQAKTCDNYGASAFVDQVTREWPDIEKRIADYPDVMAQVDEWFTLPTTVKDFKAHDWFEFSDERMSSSALDRQAFEQVSKNLIQPYLAAAKPALQDDLRSRIAEMDLKLDAYPELCSQLLGFGYYYDDPFKEALDETCQSAATKAYEKRLAGLGIELATQVQAELESGDIQLSDLASYCRDNAATFGGNHYNVSADFSTACESGLSDVALTWGKQLLDQRFSEIEAAPPSPEGLLQAHGFSFDNIDLMDGGFTYLTGSLKAANDELSAYRDGLEQKAAELRQSADMAISTEWSARFASRLKSAGDVESLSALLEEMAQVCAPITDASQMPLAYQVCQENREAAENKREGIRCESIWAKTGFPDRLKDKQVQEGKTKYQPLFDLLCEGDVIGVKDSGIFSSDYRLKATHRQGGSKPDLVISVRIIEPKKDDILAYDDLQSSAGKIDLGGLEKNDYPLVACLGLPYLCVDLE